ncbi:hypothetical protein [Mesobacillus foraminis]|uniref:Uncharacterized protein n=1 Tax=Mesobacillus foraminis TaxID=279826 RepID=A0A4R2BHT7_9BACI|nr:hypothetical protein [Mesobacillus foraminis]TCN25494.1 hypothetical protein EV146_105151 [Mesobacillus foraminis]
MTVFQLFSALIVAEIVLLMAYKYGIAKYKQYKNKKNLKVIGSTLKERITKTEETQSLAKAIINDMGTFEVKDEVDIEKIAKGIKVALKARGLR